MTMPKVWMCLTFLVSQVLLTLPTRSETLPLPELFCSIPAVSRAHPLWRSGLTHVNKEYPAIENRYRVAGPYVEPNFGLEGDKAFEYRVNAFGN